MAMTKEEVAEAVRAWCKAWHTRDIETLLVMEAPSFGFGFRPFTPRDNIVTGEAGRRESLGRFFGQKDAYSVVLEDFETAVVGEVGLAWGTFLEKWQDKGQPPASTARRQKHPRYLTCLPRRGAAALRRARR